ncbi:MAG: cysteine desulfurase [Nitrososphaerota archaeon]|jgi:cysteine desulfurase|nr:cysteine desulfurase [Nitrososphaerota archaeon]
MLYFDNNATTNIDEQVLSVYYDVLKNSYGNAGSIYPYGVKSKQLILAAREQIAKLFNAPVENIVFTSCATESNNAIINSCVTSTPTKKHIITTSIEHPSVLNPLRELERCGYELDLLSVDHCGCLDLTELSAKLRADTALVSIMHVNNEIGNIYPIKKAVNIVKSFDPTIPFHTDAVQAIGKIHVDVIDLEVDFLSFSGHKFHAPKGIGGFYVKEPQKFKPLLFGGKQEFGLRSGTENVPSIVAIGKAASIINVDAEILTISILRDKIERAVTTMYPNTEILGDLENRVCNTTNLLIPDVNAVTLVASLGELGVCISSGSACSEKGKGQSHVLAAMGFENKSIRISLSRFTTKEEVQRFISILLQTIRKLQTKE